MYTPPEKLKAVQEALKKLPEYLEEQRRKREARRQFVEKVFGDAVREIIARQEQYKKQLIAKKL